jgi:hypothetical protein
MSKSSVMLKVSKKGDKGYCVCSVPLKKLKASGLLKRRLWSLKCDFIVLKSE